MAELRDYLDWHVNMDVEPFVEPVGQHDRDIRPYISQPHK